MASYLIVDGHSMIFAWDDLRGMHARSGERARKELVERLTRYQDFTGVHVVIVFDGRGGRRVEPEIEQAVQVFYSRSGQTADDVIERLAAKYAADRDLCVATDDSLERQTVLSFGASTISSEELKARLDEAERGLQAQLRKLRNQRNQGYGR